MKTFAKFIASATVALALTLSASSAHAAALFSITGIGGAEYDFAGVYIFGDINFTPTIDDGGGFDQVEFRIYDDGTVKYSTVVQLPIAGGAGSVHFSTQYPGLIGGGAPGLGLALYDTPGEDAYGYEYLDDPVFLPHYSDPSECRENCGELPEPGVLSLLLPGFAALGAARLRRRK